MFLGLNWMTVLSQLTTLCVTNLHMPEEKISDTSKPDFHKIGFDGDAPLPKYSQRQNGEVRTSDNLLLYKSEKNTGKNGQNQLFQDS